MTPYYADDWVTIYHGDCRDVLPSLTFDVIVTDPPYGIRLNTRYSATCSFDAVAGDDERFDPRFVLDFNVPTVMFGINHFSHHIPPGGSWHVWDKRCGVGSNSYADCEMWWTSWPSGPSRILRYQWVVGLHPGKPRESKGHPTVKPLSVMTHVLTRCPPGVIADPFMGSGTTLRAAKDLGRKAIGVELDERYCEIAARRMGQEVLPL